MDIKTKEARSRNMSAIRNRDTKPEIKLRKALFAEGFRYRLQSKLPGKPDITFPGKKIAVFVDGCFWHACPDCYQEPEDNREFWQNKIEKNRIRDKVVNEQLAFMGWEVLRFWEHDVKRNLSKVINQIRCRINNL